MKKLISQIRLFKVIVKNTRKFAEKETGKDRLMRDQLIRIEARLAELRSEYLVKKEQMLVLKK
jgi:hypothetical protein